MPRLLLGVNLGVEFEDIESIYVADTVCNHIMYGAEYRVSTRVVCETGYSQTANRGPVRITVRSKLVIEPVYFQYLVSVYSSEVVILLPILL